MKRADFMRHRMRQAQGLPPVAFKPSENHPIATDQPEPDAPPQRPEPAPEGER